MHPQLSATRSRVSPGSPSDPSGDAPGQRSRPVAGPTGVRFGTLAVVASAVAHVGLMAVLASIDSPPPPPPPRVLPTTVTVLDRPPPAPIDVALIALPAPTGPAAAAPPPPPTAPPPTAPPPPRVPAAPPPRGAAIATTPAGATPAAGGELAPATAGGGEAPVGGPGGDGPPGTSIFDMRRPPAVDLSPRAVAERANLGGGAPPPPAIKPSGELHPAGGGTYRSEQPGFTVTVGRNGDVTFHDRPSVEFHLPLLDVVPKLPRTIGKKLEGWANDPWKDVREAKRDPADPDPIAMPGPERPEDEDIDEVIVPLVGATGDITDFVMRQGGLDPYADAKRAWLEKTRAERLELKAADRTRELAAAARTVRKHLARAWARAELDAAARRAAIFELWDDAAEDGTAEEQAAGEAVRKEVIGFVRAHLPAGGADAFTAAELAALNARRLSKQRFEPY